MGHGSMSCGMKTVRLFMVLFNIVFFLIGAALLALGIYVMVDPKLQKIKELVPISTDIGVQTGLSYLEIFAIIIIILGSVLLIIGFLGCCGAMRQIKFFLTCYGLIVGLLIIIEVALTIYFVVFQANFKTDFVPKLQQSIKFTYEGPLGLIFQEIPKPSAISLAWDFIMYNFQCCGVEGKLDFNGTIAWNRTNPWWSPLLSPKMKNFVYPLSCCPMNIPKENWNHLPLDRLQHAANCALNGINVYETGCYEKLLGSLNSTRTWIITCAVFILVAELFAFFFTMALCCRERKDTIYYSS